MAIVRILKKDGEVQSFEIRKIPSRGVQLTRCVTLDGRVLGITKSGSLYSVHGWPYKSGSYHGWTWHWLPGLAKALCNLGLIEEADRDETLAVHKAELERDRVSFAASQIESHCEDAGVKLTKYQKRQIKELKGSRA